MITGDATNEFLCLTAYSNFDKFKFIFLMITGDATNEFLCLTGLSDFDKLKFYF
jgi:hypothetical protein